jgi:hypothetical protein
VTTRLRRTRVHSRVVPERAVAARVELPPQVAAPFDVYVNGVRQTPGADFRIEGRTLVFPRRLAREGRLGFWRWLSLFLGIAGTYRQNDTVDVVYEAGGRRVVATGLPFVSDDAVDAAADAPSRSVSRPPPSQGERPSGTE